MMKNNIIFKKNIYIDISQLVSLQNCGEILCICDERCDVKTKQNLVNIFLASEKKFSFLSLEMNMTFPELSQKLSAYNGRAVFVFGAVAGDNSKFVSYAADFLSAKSSILILDFWVVPSLFDASNSLGLQRKIRNNFKKVFINETALLQLDFRSIQKVYIKFFACLSLLVSKKFENLLFGLKSENESKALKLFSDLKNDYSLSKNQVEKEKIVDYQIAFSEMFSSETLFFDELVSHVLSKARVRNKTFSNVDACYAFSAKLYLTVFVNFFSIKSIACFSNVSVSKRLASIAKYSGKSFSELKSSDVLVYSTVYQGKEMFLKLNSIKQSLFRFSDDVLSIAQEFLDFSPLCDIFSKEEMFEFVKMLPLFSLSPKLVKIIESTGLLS